MWQEGDESPANANLRRAWCANFVEREIDEPIELLTLEINQLLAFFEYRHLPVHLQDVSKPFHDLARNVERDTYHSPELVACLRKLLEAKDCAVRAQLSPPTIPDNQFEEEE